MHFLEYLRARSDVVSDRDWIEHWETHHAADARSRFANILPDNNNLNEAWTHTQMLLGSLKNSNELSSYSSSILSDLSFSDAVWLSVAERSLALQIAKPGEFGALAMSARRDIGDYSLNVLVAAHMGKIVDFDFGSLSNNGLTMVSTLEFGVESPLRVLATSGEGRGRSALSMIQEFKHAMAIS
jgi:hypothetical protein